ncbi:MAG: hypothetical protein A2X86_10720 [Bdellovibrionales bacterium GWA2_49_15]|nr:MAG: hypothetical protein A2X86_10720 [Bdellovibrionales bacterium GWA2_49_15]HAZ11448.1 hypothetical protein [Bdellovibrionales bacterium]
MLKLLLAMVVLLPCFHATAGQISLKELQEKLQKAKKTLESVPTQGQKIRKVETRIYDRSYRDYQTESYSVDDQTCDHRQVATYTMNEIRPEEIYYTYQVDLKYRFLNQVTSCSNYLDKNHSFPSFIKKDSLTVEKYLADLLDHLKDIKIFESSFQGHPVYSIKASAKNGYGEPMSLELIVRTDRSLLANPAIRTIRVDRQDGGLDFVIRTTLTVE